MQLTLNRLAVLLSHSSNYGESLTIIDRANEPFNKLTVIDLSPLQILAGSMRLCLDDTLLLSGATLALVNLESKSVKTLIETTTSS